MWSACRTKWCLHCKSNLQIRRASYSMESTWLSLQRNKFLSDNLMRTSSECQVDHLQWMLTFEFLKIWIIVDYNGQWLFLNCQNKKNSLKQLTTLVFNNRPICKTISRHLPLNGIQKMHSILRLLCLFYFLSFAFSLDDEQCWTLNVNTHWSEDK